MESRDVTKSLVDALASEGEHVDDGGFSLDPALALTKLREHQLADAHGYLLLLVEAAWVASAGEGELRVDTGATTSVSFGGVSLEAAQLRELFAAVFGSVAELDGDELRCARVLRLLGLAANNALGLGPKELVIEATDTEGCVHRLRIGPEGELGDIEAGDAGAEPGVRFSFVGRGVDFSRARAERELLCERCRLTLLAVIVDGERVSAGPRAEVESSPVPVELGYRKIGVAGYGPTMAEPAVVFVNRGVARTAPSIGSPPGFVAVVEVDLTMDLSRAQLQQGPELDAVKRAIREARDRLPPANYAGALARQSSRSRRWLKIGLASAAGIVAAVVLATRLISPPAEPVQLGELEQLQLECRQGKLEPCRELLARTDPTSEERPHLWRLACKAGDIPSCHELGLTLRARGSEAAVAEAEDLFDRGCQARHGPSCFAAGKHEEGCRHGHAASCELAVAEAREAGYDGQFIVGALIDACKAVPGPSCLEVAWYFHYGFVEKWDAREHSEAEFLLQGCDAGVARACELLRERPTLAEGCEAGDALACYVLAGRGLHEDPALEAKHRAFCDRVTPRRCLLYGPETHTLEPAARAALERGCELGLAEACYADGAAKLRGIGQAIDLEAAERSFAAACEAGHSGGCEGRELAAERRATPAGKRRALELGAPDFAVVIMPKQVEPWSDDGVDNRVIRR